MPHEFDTQTQNTAPPRMTDNEARAVVALWQSEQMDSPERARPTPADVAEGLDISTADAVRLLSQVRAERDAAREARLVAQQEELARAEAAARLAELRARQAEAEAREVNAHLRRRMREAFPATPAISPPTPEELQAAAEHEVKVREWERRWTRFAWVALIVFLVCMTLHH